MTPNQYCQNKAAQSGSSFYYSFLFLAPEKRTAIMAVYAFCREVDDIVDECHEVSIAQTKLEWWRNQINALFSDQGVQHPVCLALQPVITQYQLLKEPFLAMINGMEMDLRFNRYPDFSTLQEYCECVASSVGDLSIRIFGYSNASTENFAHDLGLAFQLTNIIRDIGEDTLRGRIYLPLDDIQQFGVSENDILQRKASDEMKAFLQFQIERAQDYYRTAFAALVESDRSSQKASIIMAAIYSTLLDEIARDPLSVLSGRVALTPLRKLWLAWKTAWFGFTP